MSKTARMPSGKVVCQKTGKVVFATHEAAESRLADLIGKSTLRRTYRCGSCKCWHLTSAQNKRKTVRQREKIYDGGSVPPRRVSAQTDTREAMRRMEALWAESLGLTGDGR